MSASADRRGRFLTAAFGAGISAVRREAELTGKRGKAPLSVHEEDQLRAAGRTIQMIHGLLALFVRNGVTRLPDDLSAVAWWPDAATAADLARRLMSYIAAADLEVELFDPDKLDPSAIDLGTVNLRSFDPDDYLI